MTAPPAEYRVLLGPCRCRSCGCTVWYSERPRVFSAPVPWRNQHASGTTTVQRVMPYPLRAIVEADGSRHVCAA